MIQLLATRYQKPIAYCMALIFYVSIALPSYGMRKGYISLNHVRSLTPVITDPGGDMLLPGTLARNKKQAALTKKEAVRPKVPVRVEKNEEKEFIGGPSQPEMASFKSVGTNDMVNLFTGDFSYNIPLLDVGGYPVNIFYNGGIGLEQEASWVGLGWNINPGNVNRNMRGVPDDFNGEDKMIQEQKMKPNVTWGVSISGDLELGGYKGLGFSAGASFGISFNNYLGPALDLGVKGGLNYKIAKKAMSEKSADSSSLSIGVGLGANVNSRYGLTLSPNVSLTASMFNKDRSISNGLSLATSYNSKVGIKSLQISDQTSFNKTTVKTEGEGENKVTKSYSSSNSFLLSSSLSFAKPSYVPSIRMPVTNEAFAGRFQLGGAIFGVYGSVEAEVYKQKSEISEGDKKQEKPMVGYLYYQNGANNRNAVMDFTRLNDNEVTPKTPVISAPQYSYDVFSIQGEGTGGSIRLYRNDMGYVKDGLASSKDKSLSVGLDIGIPGHYGGNFNTIKTPSYISEWGFGNKLRNTSGFTNSAGDQEAAYFRNPGESSVLNNAQFDKIGGTDLVRYKLGGTKASPTIEPVLQRISSSNAVLGEVSLTTPSPSERKKRTQVVNFLTAYEAARVGLDTLIRSYDGQVPLDINNNLKYETIGRVSEYRKAHHISEIDVTEADGKRYIYGIPVYDTIQKDFTFSVASAESSPDKVNITANEASTSSTLLQTSSARDGFVQITTTPAYAHSYLITALLSPDYVDVNKDGITEDDLGTAVKFNYTRIKQGAQWAYHSWRTPLTSGSTANFNEGNKSDTKDDKGIISYGVRESWYLHSIESKTMIALFVLETNDGSGYSRSDGKGTQTAIGGINGSDNSMKALKRIDLYSKADLKKNGLTNARPIKSVHFKYNYSLCNNTPDHPGGGKLTLERIWFTYNGQDRASKNQYVFSYGTDPADNPDYEFNASDRWGTYKPASANPSGMKNSEFSYSIQDPAQKTTIDKNAAAWSLKKILLPSGGQIEVEYESDDYAFVQNRRAADMMELAGFGNNATTITDKLYGISGSSVYEHDYVFIKVPESCSTAAEVYKKYLEGQTQLAFKIAVNMPNGLEYVTSYATIANYGVYDPSTIWVQLNLVDGISPLSLTAIEYLREQLPSQAYLYGDVNESSGLQQVGDLLLELLAQLNKGLSSPVNALRSVRKARSAVVTKSFVRLNDPDGIKYGGGLRVKSVKLKDNWATMTSQYTSVYGQEYDYTTTEVFNGVDRTISSGVASYEPSIGGEENPFQTILQVANQLPMGPTTYGAIEMPMLDAFFPAPLVGYSKVTVRSIKKNLDPSKKSRSGIGRQVTEFYTAKDFPVQYKYTAIDPASDKQEHTFSNTFFLYKYAFDSRAISQGFLVATNDMHGKLKSQTSYGENDDKSPINYTQNFYRNTGINGLNEKFDFVYASQGGVVSEGNMGIDIELMTDTREFSVKSSTMEIQAQVDLFPVIFPFWLPFIWPVSGNSENTYRAVTTTKVINYHAILDSIVAIDKGSQVSTKNLVYDAETGAVIINRTNNEFDKPVYSVNYPAWWAYSGMGLAYKNIDAIYSGVDFFDGKITSGNVPAAVIESGDELYIINGGTVPANCGGALASSASTKIVWALDKYRNTSSLTNPVHDYVFIDKDGKLFNRTGVTFRIIRSGKRNLLNAIAASVAMMTDPVATVSPGNRKIVINTSSKVLNASAMEFSEKWQTDNDIIKKLSLVYNPSTCEYTEVVDCNGYLEKNINPYRKGLLGNFRTNRSMIFYGERTETDPLVPTDISQNGFFANFQTYWDFNGSNNLVPDLSNPKWVWNTETFRFNAKGMEMETRNALDIYTSAQYGFNKTMPIAIVNNARYQEIANESFEDGIYNEYINNTSPYSCARKHFDLSNLSNSQVINTDSTSFAAHSGKYALKVNANSMSTKTIPVGSETNTNFSFQYKPDTLKALSQPGGTINNVFTWPSTMWWFNPNYVEQHYNVIGGSVNLQVTPSDTCIYDPWNARKEHTFDISSFHYLQVDTYGSYYMSVSGTADNPNENSLVGFTITDLLGNYVTSLSLDTYSSTYEDVTVDMCPGIYKVYVYMTSSLYEELPNPPDCIQMANSVTLGVAISAGTLYKTLSTNNTCIFSKPAPATDSMINPTFSVAPNKKMLFSAWVRENCGNPGTGVPCTAQTFTNSKVILTFNDGSSQPVEIKPSGPIIEGWQKIEGEFTAPGGATAMTMKLVNSSAGDIYFDDIRFAPFNSMMKSYVYDPVNLRLLAELDENNYTTFYEYDEDGTLARIKLETKEGIKTIQETRSSKQRSITTFQ